MVELKAYKSQRIFASDGMENIESLILLDDRLLGVTLGILLNDFTFTLT